MRIDVLDPESRERVFSCDGPTLFGACRRAVAEGKLPCEGKLLQPLTQQDTLGTYRFTVVGQGPACPLRCLA